MEWNDPIIIKAVNEGLKEFSACKRESKEWNLLYHQLDFVIKKQKEELK